MLRPGLPGRDVLTLCRVMCTAEGPGWCVLSADTLRCPGAWTPRALCDLLVFAGRALFGGGNAHGRPVHRPPELITVDVDVPTPGVKTTLSGMLASSSLSSGVCSSSLTALLTLEREAGGSERNSVVSYAVVCRKAYACASARRSRAAPPPPPSRGGRTSSCVWR